MNTLLIEISGLRADALRCYGSQHTYAPCVEEIAAQGLLCRKAFTSDATIAGGRAALLSGRFGIETHVVTDGAADDVLFDDSPLSISGLDAPRPLIHDYLSGHGIRTLAVSSSGRQPARWFYPGWHEVHDPWTTQHPHDIPAHDVRIRAEECISRCAADSETPFFLYLTFNDLYRYADMPLSHEEKEAWEDADVHGGFAYPDEETFAAHTRLHAAFSPRAHTAPSREALWKMRHSYHARLRAIDKEIAALRITLERLGIAENTAIIITSNHGALFGENGCYGGHTCAHLAAAHVPLIAYAKGIYDDSSAVDGLCYTLDVTPTICDLFGLAIPSGYHGIPLHIARENDHIGGRDYVVCSHGEYTAQRAIITQEWKLNRTWHSGFWDFKDTELYHYTTDPYEDTDVAAEKPEVFRTLLQRLRTWVEEYQPASADPLARIACEEPPGYLTYGDYLRAQVRRGTITLPDGYTGRWA